MLLILTAAGWVLLLVTLFIVLRDFMKYVLRKTFSSVRAQSFVDFGEYATTFFSVALLTLTGFMLYKFLMALLAYLVSGDLISFFRMMRGVYSLGHELQDPFAWQHMLTGLFGKTLVQLISIFFIYRGIRFFMYRMNQRFKTDTYSEGDVLCYGFFSVLMFIGLEILSYIQNIPQLSRSIHIFYLVIANTALICYFLSLSHLHQMLRVRYRRSLPRYVTFSRTTKNIVVSPSATILATWIIGVVLNFPLYLGTQFLENNAAVLLFGLLSLTLFIWVARKLLAKGFNYFGAIMFFESQ
ncbi:MAG: hypothetical protein P8X57_07265 [Cyclobacteriaceae bacterium]